MAQSKGCFPTRSVPLNLHPATLPQPDFQDDVDHLSIVSRGLDTFRNLSADDLADNVIWRDTCALTGTLRTFFSKNVVLTVWQTLSAKHKPTNFSTIPDSSRITRIGPHGAWVEAMFTFETTGERSATCSGIIGLVPGPDKQKDSLNWQIWLLSTILERPKGFPDVDVLSPQDTNASTNGEVDPSNRHYDVLIAGASIAGLTMASRAQALGLSYLIVEKNEGIGDNWSLDRYASLKLHTSKNYNQMPYEPRTFREEDPYHLDTKALANGFKRFVDTFGIEVTLSTELFSGSYSSGEGRWSLELRKKGGNEFQVTATHCVLAVGSMGVKPNWPEYPGRDKFRGDVIHGLHWRNADQWKGKSKRGVCIGSANTAHGVIADMASADFESITMIQRSRTWLMPSSTFEALVDPVFNYDTPVALSDRMLLGYPLPVQRLLGKAGIEMCADARPEYFERMEAQGWDIERNGDLWGMMYDREGGHFFDLGSGELIANGTVKVKCDALPVAYTETGLEMSDGSHIDADVIVMATGYSGNMKDTACRIFGDKIGGSLEEFWQCDEEGESRGAWKYTGHPRLWFTGHGFAHSRYYAKFVAMHIRADVDGKPIETYTDTPGR